MIEIATCLNDLSEGAVWRGKNSYSRLVKISSVWEQNVKGDRTVCVGFYLWDSQGTEDEREAWKVGKVLGEAEFRHLYQYAESHALNNAREAAKNEYLISRLLSDISDCFEVESRMAGRELVKKLMTLTKRAAGYEILAHEWDEGCAGTGCCADTADMGGDKLVDENFLTADEIAAVLGDQEGVPAAEPCVTSDIDTELCPNGQSREECTEVDPCETCWQDQQAEGDVIEISMGLKEG